MGKSRESSSLSFRTMMTRRSGRNGPGGGQQMSLAVQSGDGLIRRLTFVLEAQELDSRVDERLQKLSAKSRIRGFRPGKAPLAVVRQHYGSEVRQEVLRDLIERRYWDSVAAQSLRPASAPAFEVPPAVPGQPLTVTAVFEVMPEFQVKGYEGIPLKRPRVEITPQDEEAVIARLRRQRAHWHPVEREARIGDRVRIDYDAELGDGSTFPGGTGRGVFVELGAGREIPGFEEALQGIRKDEERRFSLSFPHDYGQGKLAGQEVRFTVRASEVGELHLPEVDEAFCQSFGTADVGEWGREVRESMRNELDQAIRQRLHQAIDDHLVTENPIELPRALVEQEVLDMHRSTLRQLGLEVTQEIPDSLRSRYETAARRRVTLALVYRELVRELQLTPESARVEALLDTLAQENGQTGQLPSDFRSRPEIRGDVERLALDEQLVDWLIARAKFEEVPDTFAQMMGLEPPPQPASPESLA